MTVVRIEHIGVVVGDLEAAEAFFVDLGLEVEGHGSVGDERVDRIVGLEGAASDITMLRPPDGGAGCVELTRFKHPPSPDGDAGAPANAVGLRHLLFVVDDVHATVARLQANHGTELVGEVVNWDDQFLLVYLRGPEGIIVELAEELGS